MWPRLLRAYLLTVGVKHGREPVNAPKPPCCPYCKGLLGRERSTATRSRRAKIAVMDCPICKEKIYYRNRNCMAGMGRAWWVYRVDHFYPRTQQENRRNKADLEGSEAAGAGCGVFL